MCGGFNNAIIKKILPEFAQDDQAYFFGSKTFNISKTYLPNLNLVHLYYQIEKLLDPEHCFWLAKNIFNFFLTNRFQKLKIVYTKFINNITFQPTIIQILPIEKTTFNILGVLDLNPKITSQEYELSIDPVEMLYELIPQFFSLSLYGGLLESKTSEFSARYQAMSAATDNANNLKNEYKLEYNRVRQALITQEIIEIISGSL